MIYYISGALKHADPSFVIIDQSGIGYGLHISLTTYSQIRELQNVLLYTYLHPKNEGGSLSGLELYGFANPEEKEVFIKLISVSGIGVNTARMMLSSMHYEEVVSAIQQSEIDKIKRVKGIGPKTAERVVLELKDKMGAIKLSNASLTTVVESKTEKEQAISALVALGIARAMAEKAVEKALPDSGNSIEKLIKLALNAL